MDVQGQIVGRFINIQEPGRHEPHVGAVPELSRVVTLPLLGPGDAFTHSCPASRCVEGRGLLCVSFFSVAFSSE